MNIKHFLLPVVICFSIFSLVSCNDDIDLTADYKDISFSYSILDMNDTTHYFKIYKGFLTDDNAFEQASNWENIYYPVDSIQVRLEEYLNGQLNRSAILDTTTKVNKVPGYFAQPKQLLYYSNWKLNEDATYRLVIKNVNTGKESYAETQIVGDFSVRRPTGNWNMNLDQLYKIQFYAANNAAAYDIYMDFYYIEVDNVTGAIAHKKLSKKLNPDLIRDNQTVGGDGREIGYNITPNTFYTFLSQNIEPNSHVTRYIDAIDNQPYYCIQLNVWAANDAFVKYRDVATPNSSIVQNRLEYTNFISDNDNAYGIFASRNHCTKNLKLDNAQAHNEDTLVKGSATSNLNFDYYRNSPLFISEEKR
ncbi:MAG: hypothetical protein MJZ57_08350 [Bacteroidales bacterium]|nr:hypothetical protein [Bacteroidales bacterium]